MRLLLLILIPAALTAQVKPTPVDTMTTSASNVRVVSTDTAVVLLRKIDIKGKTTTLSISSQPASWRLVHDGKRVIDLFYSSGLTHTINKLECFKTREETDKRVSELKLIIDADSRIDSTDVSRIK
jgi:hypothetical protein